MAPTLAPSSIALTRLEASITGESALIDREHGRVLWESGGGTVGRLSASVAPKLDELGVAHVKAKVLTGILLIGISGLLVRWVQSKLNSTDIANRIQQIRFLGPLLVLIANLTVLRIPSFHPWTLVFFWLLYIIESYTCSTREYLSQTILSPDDIEPYLEQLRNETAVVTWQVRCFHYEDFTLPRPDRVLSFARRKNDANLEIDNQSRMNPDGASSIRLRRKVVTSRATGNYQIKHCLDKTIAGIWKRAPLLSDGGAPFIKLVLSKLLILSDDKTRLDYMKQQSQFVSEHGQADECAEFSTSIQVPGFQRRLLAARPDVGRSRFFSLSAFWIASLLLMTVPYRLWFSNHCDEVRVTVIKEAYVSPPRRIDPTQRHWLAALYTASNSSKVLDDSESFRDMMRQIRLYRSSSASNQPSLDSNHLPEDAPMLDDVNITGNSTMIDDEVAENRSNDKI